ncbi:MAG: aldo/keto reductase [Clostridia bacterium]|nr:aldo/keto reductase [Clostridia bacterium]
MLEKDDFFPIGIGTYKLNLEDKENTLKGLLYSVEKGQNFMSTALVYDNGRVVDFLKEFFRKVDREKIFLMAHLERYIEKLEDVEKQVNEYLTKMDIDYIDAVQVHASYVSKIPLAETYNQINELIKKGKVRYISISNSSLEELKEINEKFGVYSFEGVYNLECKLNENIGIINYCKENNIKFICYQALRRNRIANNNYPLLTELSEKYGKTQNQILLNWLIKEKGVLALIKSTNKDNIDSNLESLNFEISIEDMNKLNEFKHKGFDTVKIDWKETGKGVLIDQLANQF